MPSKNKSETNLETIVENHKVVTKKIEKYVKLVKVFQRDFTILPIVTLPNFQLHAVIISSTGICQDIYYPGSSKFLL